MSQKKKNFYLEIKCHGDQLFATNSLITKYNYKHVNIVRYNQYIHIIHLKTIWHLYEVKNSKIQKHAQLVKNRQTMQIKTLYFASIDYDSNL